MAKAMPDSDFEVILGNSNSRFSGVTSTMLQVLEIQKRRIPLVVLGGHHLPEDVPRVTFWQLARLARRPLEGGRHRVFHARRNDEMIQALLLKKVFRARVRIVFTSTAQRRKTWVTRWLMRQMDGLLSTCTAAASYMSTPPDRIIPHGINVERYHPAVDRDRLYSQLGLPCRYGIGIFGRVRHQKGVDLLVDAAIRVLPEFADYGLVIVGEITPDQESFVETQKQRLKTSGLDQRVVFTGELPFDRIPDYFRAMSIVTALSRNEGFGLTVLEAMSTKAAVVASKAGAWPDIIRDGDNGYLIPVGDSDHLARRLAALMLNPSERKRLAEKGRQTVLTDYTVQRESEALMSYYRSKAEA